MIRTIQISFHDPFTGIWVKGKQEYHFTDEDDLTETCARWEKALKDLFRSPAAKVEVCDWGHEK